LSFDYSRIAQGAAQAIAGYEMEYMMAWTGMLFISFVPMSGLPGRTSRWRGGRCRLDDVGSPDFRLR
jgi:hypothetical protein